MPPFTLPSETEITLSVPVLVFAVVVCTLSGVIAGLAPAVQTSRTSAAETMREGAWAIGDRRLNLRRGLVVLEFALALTLLAGGGMAVQAWARQMRADLGFRADHLTTFSLPVPRGRLGTPEQVRTFYGSLAEQVSALPGVVGSSVSTGMPVAGVGFRRQFEIADSRAVRPEARPWTGINIVSTSYHATFGIPILRGRAFADTDREGSRPVAIVNETFAARFLAGRDPIGRHVLVSPIKIGAPGTAAAPPIDWEIVGVQGDAANAGPGRPAAPELMLPFAQNPWPTVLMAVRTTGDVAAPQMAIADILHTLDPTVPMARVQTIEQTLSESVAADRFYTVFFAAFAGVALLLAAVGIYGVGKRRVLGQILREGLTTALAGTAIGAIGAAFIGRTLRGAIYGIEPSDPLLFAAVAFTLLFAALVACLVPARRAASVDPMVALRQN
jgi:putative ABC transport system permease protein